MKVWLCLWLIVLGGATGVLAGEKAQAGGAELLDEAIWWPGDFGQVCRDDSTDGPFERPWIPGYGTRLTQEYFLSEARIEGLRKHKAAVAAEIVKRLEAFDWRTFPKGDAVSAGVKGLAEAEFGRALAASPGGAFPRPQKPENNRALGPQMLMIIEKIGAIEALPQLLRLEEELDELNREAMEARWGSEFGSRKEETPKVYVPPIETGDWSSYDEQFEEWVNLGRPEDSAWLAWKGRVFKNRYFQAQMLGVCLALLEQQKYAPLKESLPGRVLALAGKGDVPWRDQLPWTDEVRREVRQLAKSFLTKDAPEPPPRGEAMLESLIRTPGDFSQLCSLGPAMTLRVPLPSFSHLTAKEHRFNEEARMRMQAYREALMPVLRKRLAGMDVRKMKPPSVNAAEKRDSGQRSDALGPLLLEVMEITQAIECLPEVLRLEQELHEVVTQAQRDQTAPVPDLWLFAGVGFMGEPGEESVMRSEAQEKRRFALFSCTVYQRELLSLMKTLLVREEFPAMVNSEIVKALRAAGEKAMAPTLAEITAEDKIPTYLRPRVRWNPETEKPEIKAGMLPVGEIPYSDAVREEIRSVAEAFLKEVPPEKRKGAGAMVLGWLERPYW